MQLERHLKDLAPADRAVIDELLGATRRFARFDLLGMALAGPWERLRSLAMLPVLVKYGRITLDQFAQRFTDPFLRRAFPTLVYDWPQMPMAMLLSLLSRTQMGDLGWPVGGSIALARAIEQRFIQLGGEIRYQAKVRSILVENDRAVGVRFDDGSEQRADIVVSNANGHATIYGMLGGRYISPAISAYYGAPEDRIEMGIHVSLGLARDLSAEPHAIVLPLAKPVMIANEERHRLYVEPFGFDRSLAPPGKGVLKVVMATSFDYWQKLGADPAQYAQEKQSIAETVVGLLEPRFPGLHKQLEVTDVATPLTTLRLTGNAHGYRAPITAMVRELFTGHRLSQTLPGLGNFFMVGQWAGSGGVPLVAAMGRDVVRAICRSDRRAFVTLDAASSGSRSAPPPALHQTQ
jgi:phytoene dehydrogenase-like protein